MLQKRTSQNESKHAINVVYLMLFSVQQQTSGAFLRLIYDLFTKLLIAKAEIVKLPLFSQKKNHHHHQHILQQNV